MVFITKVRQLVDPDQKRFLTNFTDSEESIDSIEKQVLQSQRPLFLRTRADALLGFIGFLLAFFGLGRSIIHSFSNGYVSLMILGGILYIGAIIYAPDKLYPEYWTFMSLVACITKAESAKKTPPISSARKALSHQLIGCGKNMNAYAPRSRSGLLERIAAREARLTRLFFEGLVYPALVGTDEELDNIKEVVAQAALQVGVGNWTAVRKLRTDTNEYPATESFQSRGPRVWKTTGKLILELWVRDSEQKSHVFKPQA